METAMMRDQFSTSQEIRNADTAGCQPDSGDYPICVDLHGTILRCDTLLEGVFAFLVHRPLESWKLFSWLFRGKAFFKQRLARETTLDVEFLPYEPALVNILREQRALGRKVIMTTAADRAVAERVAAHLGCFDEVLASDGARNLKGKVKLEAILSGTARGGFDYIGDSLSDLPCIESARKGLAVNPSYGLRRVLKKGQVKDVEILDSRSDRLETILKALRVHQWTKNLVLLLPVILAHKVTDLWRFIAVIMGMVTFSLASSASYILNDLMDVKADRKHPVKRDRTFSSGNLAFASCITLASVCLAGAIIVGILLRLSFVLWLAVYLFVALSYSMTLKRVPLLDVFVLAVLYTVRVVAGGAAASVEVSQWMLAFSMFFFLGLAFLKRYIELRRLAVNGLKDAPRRGYQAEDLELIRVLGVTSGFMAVLVLALYLNSSAVVVLYTRPTYLWLSCVLVAYWISRVWLLAHRGLIEEDPVFFAIRDRVTYLLIAFTGAAVMLAF